MEAAPALAGQTVGLIDEVKTARPDHRRDRRPVLRHHRASGRARRRARLLRDHHDAEPVFARRPRGPRHRRLARHRQDDRRGLPDLRRPRVYITARKAAACDATAEELSANTANASRCRPTSRRWRASNGLVRGSPSARTQARHPGQQRRRGLGRGLRRVPRERLGQGRGPEHEDPVLPDPGPDRPAARGRQGSRGQGDQHRSIDGQSVAKEETYPYGASKAGLLHMTKRMALRLAPDNIAVSAIAPGAFASDMNKVARDHADAVSKPFPPAGSARRGHGRRGDLPGLAGRGLCDGVGRHRGRRGQLRALKPGASPRKASVFGAKPPSSAFGLASLSVAHVQVAILGARGPRAWASGRRVRGPTSGPSRRA
jgi:hypothetical protein